MRLWRIVDTLMVACQDPVTLCGASSTCLWWHAKTLPRSAGASSTCWIKMIAT
uniref:hypothetical protein n=1 Tax=Candidatus Limisoma sp. TaxID=3076476 RepID=UPI0040283AC9